MGQTRRDRHRDKQGRRQLDEEPVDLARVFRMTEAQRQQIAKCLRYIDEARRALEGRQSPDNREIIRELRTSADKIFDVVNDLEEV